jgi:eukaryotic-like serine/threonine-protein kinase
MRSPSAQQATCRVWPGRALFCCVAVLLLLALPLLSQTPSVEWRQFRGNPRLTGVTTTTVPATLKAVWTYDTKDSILSSAAIADGVVYVGVGNGELLAVDFATGKLKWKAATKHFFGESSPAVAGGAVYIGDLDGFVHAFSTADGKVLWTFKTEGEIKSSPVFANDVVLIGSYDTRLYAIEARTGKLRWKFQTDGMVHATPAVVGDLAFIAGCDEVFRAIRLSDGKEAYKIPMGAYTGASALVEGDRAYFGTFNYDVLALDLKARKILWRYDNPDYDFPFYSSAALYGGRVILGGRDKFVRALNAASGKEVWSFATRARVDSSPAIAGNRVYIGSSDGHLYVLDAATGTKHGDFDAGSALVASPAIAGGRVVIGSQDGILYCLG